MIALVMECSCMGLEVDGCVSRRLGASCVGDDGALTIDSRLLGGGSGDCSTFGVFEVVDDIIGKPHMLTGVALETGVSELPRGRPLPDRVGANLWLFLGFGGVGGCFSLVLRFFGSADGGDLTSEEGRRTIAGGGVPDRREAALVTRVGFGESTSVVDLLMMAGVGDFCLGVVGALLVFGDRSGVRVSSKFLDSPNGDGCRGRAVLAFGVFIALIDLDRERAFGGVTVWDGLPAFRVPRVLGGVTRGLFAAA